MAFSGGTFSRTFDCTTDRDNGVKILASKFDTELDGMATGLSTCILKDGTQTCTAAIPFAEGLTVPDNKTIILGTNSDITIQYDESTNDSLEIAANVEGAALGIVLKADQGDDNADQHKVGIADGGTLTMASKISGSFVSYLTHTPNSTVASSTTAVAGNLTVGGDLTLGSGAVISEAELEAIDGVTAGTVTASKAVIVDSNKDAASFRNITLTGELDAGSLDVSGDADIDGTLEADAMTLNGTAITATATLDTGISNNNVPKFTSGVADNDFLRVDGTAIEGRSASEVLSDIAAAPAAGSSNIVTTGALNSGSITSGFGAIDNGSSNITTTGVGTFGSLDISGNIDVDGTTNLDAVDIDGAVDIAGNVSIAGTIINADNNTDDTNKIATFLSRQFDSGTETEGFLVFQTFANSSGNRIDIGGATSAYNAATEITFNTAANTTTRTGTEALNINSSGNATFSAGATISSSSSGEFNALTISQANNTSGNESRIRFKRTTDAGSDREVAAIVADRVGGNDTALAFEVNTDGADGAVEKARLRHDGTFLLGATSVTGSGSPVLETIGAISAIKNHTDTSSSGNVAYGAGNQALTLGNNQGGADNLTSKLGFSVTTTGSTSDGLIEFGSTAAGSGEFRFYTESGNTIANRMTIAASGNVGIGTASPSGARLHVVSSDLTSAKFETSNGNSITLGYDSLSASRTGDFFIDNRSASGNNIQYRCGSSAAHIFNTGTSDIARLVGTEFLVGMTTANGLGGSSDVNGVEIGPGYININRDDTSTATQIAFGKNGSAAGHVVTTSSGILFGEGNANLKFSNAGDAITPVNASGTVNDDSLNFGSSSARFDDIFATNGTIQTSDQNEKQNIAALTTAEITAAKSISALFKTFKWKSKVTAKGDAARTHTGVIAQEVQAAMSAAGLDPTKYAFWCSDTWTNDDGNEQTRMGVRYPELLAFVGAATEQRLADIETRLAALEE